MSELTDRMVTLRDGTEIEIVPMDLGRFIEFKDLLARIAERIFTESATTDAKQSATLAVASNGNSGNLQLVRALKKLTEDDVLDLLQVMTGYKDRSHLSTQFRPAVLFRAITITAAEEGIDLGGLLGEVPRSSGQNLKTVAATPSS